MALSQKENHDGRGRDIIPEEIVAPLRQVDMLTSQGQNVADAVRSIGVTESMRPSALRRLLPLGLPP